MPGVEYRKNGIKISVLCICMLLTVLGCGTGTDNKASADESMEPIAAAESDWEEQTKTEDHYEEMTAATEEALAGNDTEEPGDNDSGNVMPVSGYDTDMESEVPSDESMEPAVVTESNQEEQTDPRDYYEELITAAKECIEGRVEEGSEDYEFSSMIYWYGAYYGASMGLGYLIEDIDGDGTDELIFGQNDEPDSAWNGVIYDLYTISDGELVHVFDGGERARYNLCENGMIAYEGADGAPMSTYAYYIFEGTELHLVEAVLCNGWEDEDNPWFYSTQTDSYYETEKLEPVSEEQARTIMEKYVYEHPTFIPFVEE